MQQEKNKMYTDDIFVAAWLGLNKIDVVAVLKDDAVLYEVIKSRKAATYFNLYNQLPRVIIQEYAPQLLRLHAQALSVRKENKG